MFSETPSSNSAAALWLFASRTLILESLRGLISQVSLFKGAIKPHHACPEHYSHLSPPDIRFPPDFPNLRHAWQVTDFTVGKPLQSKSRKLKKMTVGIEDSNLLFPKQFNRVSRLCFMCNVRPSNLSPKGIAFAQVATNLRTKVTLIPHFIRMWHIDVWDRTVVFVWSENCLAI